MCVAAEPDPLTQLDQALKTAATFEFGKDSAALSQAEDLVMRLSNDPVGRAAVEDRLIRALTGVATHDAKEFYCRQLFTVGTERSVPVLEGLLADSTLSHIARFALTRNESPAAGDALRRALIRTGGSVQAGMINSLGLRREQRAVPDLEKYLLGYDRLVARASANALGQIGGAGAIKALETARGRAIPEVVEAIDTALVIGAERLVADGNAAAGLKVYEALYGGARKPSIRIAALRGLAMAAQEKGLPRLVEAMRGSDAKLRAAAISFSSLVRGREVTVSLAAQLGTLPPEAQELLLVALGDRGDTAAAAEVAAALGSAHANVRVAACSALGSLGDAASVEPLIRLAATGSEAEQTAARASLQQLTRGEVDAALVRELEATDAKLATEAARALSSRHATIAFVPLRKIAAGSDAGLRREAIHALGLLAEEPALGDLVALIADLHEGDYAAFEDAARVAFGRVGSPEPQAAVVLSVLGRASVKAKPTLLHLLSSTGMPSALTALRAAVKDEDAAVSGAAVRALADWPDATPADDLLTIVRTARAPAQKVIALRGYVRMAALGKDPGAMYARALELADRIEDKRLVLGSLGEAEPNQALRLLQPCLKNDQLKSEAALAMVQVAERIWQTDLPRAKTVLRDALAATSEPRIHEKAQEILNQVEAFDAHILDWMGTGPFQDKDKDAHGLFTTVFPPEVPNAPGANWTRITKGLGTWDVNLLDALGGGDHAVGYARTRVWSAASQAARLEVGSDDGIKIWFNGVVVHANDAERSLSPRQDMVKITLKEGWNELLLKITNQGGGWGFGCRIRKPDGTAMEGLKYEAR